MQKSTLIIGSAFALFHLLLVAPFVPVANILPAWLGALSLSSMAVSLILAARWRLVDRFMGGPDKSYVAHRWLGFFALAGALGHWALASSVGAGVLPVLAESGEESGTIAALGLVVMTAAAMVRAIPYHLWKLSHMLMGPIFLLAAYHTFFVASPLAVGVAPWALMAIVSAVGLVAWGQTLLRKRMPTKLVTVSRVTPFEGGVDVTLSSDTPLPPYRPGQFATLSHNQARSETHPFTIAGGDEWSRRFVIRAAGDWTGAFVQNVAKGDVIRMSGGFGRFLPQFDAKRKEQLWVAGGVGITPFLAALERMSPDDSARIILIYCIRSRASAGAIETVEKHAARLPQLALTVVNEADGNLLIESRLADVIRGMSHDAEAYLCGPDPLKHVVELAWSTQGKTGSIHSERFDFRGAYGLSDLVYIGDPVIASARLWVTSKMSATNAPVGS